MKGNKMSAILAILLMLGGMLSGALFVPFHASAQPFPPYGSKASAIAVNVSPGGTPIFTKLPYNNTLSVGYPTVKPNTGYTFYAYIDVINVTSLGAYSVGFTWNYTYLHVLSIVDGGFLKLPSQSTTGLLPFSINNAIGEVDAVANSVEYNATLGYVLGPTGSGHLLKVEFNVTNFSPPYTGTYPGAFVNMIHLNVSSAATYVTTIANNATTDVTPLQANVYSGLFKMYVTPTAPTATFTMAPYPYNVYNITAGVEDLYADLSSGGSLGYGPSLSISYYCWNFKDGTGWHNVTGPGTLGTGTGKDPVWTFPAPPGPPPSPQHYAVELVVNSTVGTSTVFSLTLTVEYATKPLVTVRSNPLSEVMVYPTYGPGSTFTAYIDVGNVTSLFSFEIGFTFDPTALQVLSVTDGGFLTSAGATHWQFLAGSIDNHAGVVSGFAETLFSDDASLAPSIKGSATGHLLQVNFEVNPSLWPPYTNGYPGGPTLMIGLSNTTIQMYDNMSNIITPLSSYIFNGTFTMYLMPSTIIPPTAIFGVYPSTTVYKGTMLTFDATPSRPGFDGYESVPIEWYIWNFGDGSPILTTLSPIVTHVFPDQPFTVTLIVQDTEFVDSAPASRVVTIEPLPYGCFIDLTTQNWRYIDPITLSPVPNGLGWGAGADLFRPGDFVQLFANVTYNGDEVANQLVTFQVEDNFGNTVFVGTAISNSFGIAEYDFRIPWPATYVTAEFGTWTARASWQVGSNFGYPYEVTQNDTTAWEVGWGLWITSISLSGGTPALPYMQFSKLPPINYVTVKINVEDDYLYPKGVPALAVATIYDDLLVPLSGPAYIYQTFYYGVTTVTFPAILIPEYAYVGTGIAKTSLLTTWPWYNGTAFCPEVTQKFTILLS
jgi:hypothetical protein